MQTILILLVLCLGQFGVGAKRIENGGEDSMGSSGTVALSILLTVCILASATICTWSSLKTKLFPCCKKEESLTPSGLRPFPRDSSFEMTRKDMTVLDPSNLSRDHDHHHGHWDPVTFEPLPTLHMSSLRSREEAREISTTFASSSSSRTDEYHSSIFRVEDERSKNYYEKSKSFDADWSESRVNSLTNPAYGNSTAAHYEKSETSLENSMAAVDSAFHYNGGYKKPDVPFSNISHLFESSLYVVDMPMGITTTDQLSIVFETAISIEIVGRIGIAQFESPLASAHAFHFAQRKRINGEKLQISIVKPETLARKMDGGWIAKCDQQQQVIPPVHTFSPSSASSGPSSLPTYLHPPLPPPSQQMMENRKPNGQRRLIKYVDPV